MPAITHIEAELESLQAQKKALEGAMKRRADFVARPGLSGEAKSLHAEGAAREREHMDRLEAVITEQETIIAKENSDEPK